MVARATDRRTEQRRGGVRAAGVQAAGVRPAGDKLAELVELSMDYADAPDQVGAYARELEAAGGVGEAELALAWQRLAQIHGEAYADAALRGQVGGAPPSAPPEAIVAALRSEADALREDKRSAPAPGTGGSGPQDPEVQEVIRSLTTVGPVWQTRIHEDIETLKGMLRSGDLDAHRVVDTFERWTLVDRQKHREREPLVSKGWLSPTPGLDTLYLDAFLDRVEAEGVRVSGGLGPEHHVTVMGGLFEDLEAAARARLVAIRRQSRGGAGRGALKTALRQWSKADKEAFAKDPTKRPKGTPFSTTQESVAAPLSSTVAGVAAGAAGAMRSLPGGIGAPLADSIETSAVEFQEFANVSHEEASTYVQRSSMIGQSTGVVIQLLGTGGLAAAGQAGMVLRGVEVLDGIVKIYKQYRPVMDIVWKVLHDFGAAVQQGHGYDSHDALISSLVGAQEVLVSELAKVATADEGSLAEGGARAIARYLAQRVIRHLLTNVVVSLLKFVREHFAAGRQADELLPALASGASKLLGDVLNATVKGVVGDISKRLKGVDSELVRAGAGALLQTVEKSLSAAISSAL